MRRAVSILLLVAAMAIPAWARDSEGRLALIQTPNNGLPAVLRPGDSFEATLRSKAELQLLAGSSGVASAMAVEWLEPFEGRQRAHCTIGRETPAGTYTLAATADGVTDQMPRAVFVRESFPDAYLFLHLTDTHVGKTAADGQPASAALRRALAANTPLLSPPTAPGQAGQSAEPTPSDGALPELAFIVITGDLTHEAGGDQFREFLEALDTCPVPTFVCAGNHDRAGGEYGRYFGPSVQTMRFGQDGYLFFDTKDFLTADDADASAGEVMLGRRALKDCRWTVALTHRYEMEMGMRTQLALFVDDPVDLLIFGHWHRANTAEERATPWGVRMVATPALVNGAGRPFLVRSQDVRPSDPQWLPGFPPPKK